MLGQQLHIRQVALLHKHGTQLATEKAPRTAPMSLQFPYRSGQSVNPWSSSRYFCSVPPGWTSDTHQVDKL